LTSTTSPSTLRPSCLNHLCLGHHILYLSLRSIPFSPLLLAPSFVHFAPHSRPNQLQQLLPPGLLFSAPLHTSGVHTLQLCSSPLPGAKNDQTGDLTQLSPSTTTAQHHTTPAITITITSASAHLQPDQRSSSTSSFSWSPNPANLFSSYQHLSCTILTSSLSNLRTEQQPSLTQHIVMRAAHKLVTACREQRDAASRRLGDYNVPGVVDNKSRDGCCMVKRW
jgi:hypothetical protein